MPTDDIRARVAAANAASTAQLMQAPTGAALDKLMQYIDARINAKLNHTPGALRESAAIRKELYVAVAAITSG